MGLNLGSSGCTAGNLDAIGAGQALGSGLALVAQTPGWRRVRHSPLAVLTSTPMPTGD